MASPVVNITGTHCGQLTGHFGGQGIFSKVKPGLDVPREMLSWEEYKLERTRGSEESEQ